ncbi:MAG: cell division protein ZapA [Bacteroidales bacterium]|nr:cell division protein ZapA [Bacteroidales bacterium]MDT8431712.1 cell division protein ZapA [Bacteroidales bacterium]
MDEKLAIKVQIAERFYPLKIERREEERIRKAAKLINDRLLQYKQRYTDKDPQDFLAMAALQFVIQLLDCESKQNFLSLEEDLKVLSDELDVLLKEE